MRGSLAAQSVPIAIYEGLFGTAKCPHRHIYIFFLFFGIHSSRFNGPLRRKATPLYKFVTHIPSHGSAGRRVGWHTGVLPKGEGQCNVEG